MAHNHEAWCRLRRLGPFRFVLLYGVLGWGLPFGLLFPGIFVVLIRIVDNQAPSYSEIVPWMLPLGLHSGIGFGWWIWVLGEQGHRRWLAQSESRERAA